MRALILLIFAVLLAATVSPSIAASEEDMEQLAVNLTVEQIRKEKNIAPTEWILEKDMRAIKSDTYRNQTNHNQTILYIPLVKKVWRPVYRQDLFAEIARTYPNIVNQTTFSFPKQYDVKNAILSEGGKIVVYQFRGNDLENGKIVFTAPFSKYHIIPSSQAPHRLGLTF